jgi:hypothetical protein
MVESQKKLQIRRQFVELAKFDICHTLSLKSSPFSRHFKNDPLKFKYESEMLILLVQRI